jgi:hypothetical protein
MLEALAGIGIALCICIALVFVTMVFLGIDVNDNELLPIGLCGVSLSLIALATIFLNRAYMEDAMHQEAVKHGVGGYVADKDGKPKFEWKTLAEYPSATSAPVK